MKGYLYILQSNSGHFYIGSTNNIERRIYQHNHGHTYTTKRMNGLKLIFSQEYSTIIEARKIERKIKSWRRKDFIEKIIKDGYIKTDD